MKRILCSFSINPDFLQFVIPELKSILKPLPIPLEILLQQQLQGKKYNNSYQINHKVLKNFPFVILNVPDFKNHRQFFNQACLKSVMITKLVLLISSGDTYEELLKSGDQQILVEQCRNNEEQVICEFNSRNRILEREDQLSRIHNVLGGFDVRGKVNFKNPKVRYQIFEDHQWYQNHHKTSLESTLKHIYFGIELCSNKIGTAKFNNIFELKNRIYLGPTSTDNDLAFMMCNQALVQSGNLVIDPFVGTGGLLIPAASKGAITFGSDLDIRVLNGYSVGRINKKSPFYKQEKKFELFTPKINLNFQQYNLLSPNIIRVDSTKLAFRETQFFDAIITDPPYGIRAMSRSVTSKKQIEQTKKQEEESNSASNQSENEDETKQISEEVLKKRERRRIQKENRRKRKAQMPQQEKNFKLSIVNKLNRQRIDQWDKFDRGKIENTERQKIFKGLLDFSRKHLKKGGRLVFLYPIFQEQDYTGVNNLPDHEGFIVVDMSENKISKGNSRILVTLQKE